MKWNRNATHADWYPNLTSFPTVLATYGYNLPYQAPRNPGHPRDPWASLGIPTVSATNNYFGTFFARYVNLCQHPSEYLPAISSLQWVWPGASTAHALQSSPPDGEFFHAPFPSCAVGAQRPVCGQGRPFRGLPRRGKQDQTWVI